MILAQPYFWPKSGENDVTLTSFTAALSKPWRIPLVRVCEIDQGRDTKSLVAISLLLFFLLWEERWRGPKRSPIGARVSRSVPKMPKRAHKAFFHWSEPTKALRVGHSKEKLLPTGSHRSPFCTLRRSSPITNARCNPELVDVVREGYPEPPAGSWWLLLAV